MRTNSLIAIALALSLTAPLLGQDREAALAIVEQAIKARGGAEALGKAALAVRNGEGIMTFFGKEMKFTDEVLMDLPERLRVAVVIDKKSRVTIVLNGTKGWQAQDGVTIDLPSERVNEVREEAFVLWLSTLTPLKQDGMTLRLLADAVLNGRKVAALRVSSKGHSDAVLYFDRESHLLVRILRRAREAGLEVEKDYQFSDYKDTDGGKLPTRIVESIGGKKFSELTAAKYQFLRKSDESLFGKP